MRHDIYNYNIDYKPVIKITAGTRTPNAVEFDKTKVTSWSYNDRTVRILPPGIIAAKDGEVFRPLPRQNVTADVAANATSFTCNHPQVFVVGDVLTVVGASETVTIGGTWLAADTLTVSLDDQDYTYTVAAEDIGGSDTETRANIAVKLKDLLVDHTVYVKDAVARIFAADFKKTESLTVVESSTAGTITAGSGNLVSNPAVGTVSAVDVDNKTVTISAASTELFSGVPVGVVGVTPMYGMVMPTNSFDLEHCLNYATWSHLTVFAERLPYWDAELTNLFKGIELA